MLKRFWDDDEEGGSSASPLHGQAAVVTGAGRGLGRAIALSLARAGCRVVLTARNADELAATAALVEDAGGEALAVAADVTSPEQVGRVHDEAIARFEAVDIVVNNAGNLVLAPFVALPTDSARAGLTFDDWRSTQSVHLDGAFHVLRAFAPAMLTRGHGRVINIVSSALGRVVPFSSAYDTAKAGLAQLTRSLAFEWARYGVTVNAIAVGQVRTSMTEAAHDDPKTAAWLMRRIPVRRAGDPAEIGWLVTTLAGPESAFLTGQIIGLDGGETL
ncbi:SDR family NAD(P)-dependent oxidoreductase [Pseudofrankia inefficax]|uniref:Short-chain dehydrogenase/reductase SDR n=1 Tax=Pseudofrankia inefficax (strain DSM 45817 / CECT 9037 / DDB 130130 / EuI1c) TaxID=298654 RepID=E3IVA7_PSEI1|nr:SDR family NAD(P)-dependent oxidoreductase [Pseudofrankia inefficax]ADP81271.1 short-chain dehydrogenase/reductase SDR [Pseudofrankia inefficax]